MSAPEKRTIGFLLVPLQLLDMAGPMDVLVNSSTAMVTKYGAHFLPLFKDHTTLNLEDLISSSLDITFHHIGPTMDPVLTTGNFYAKPTCTVDTCPKLDYLFVGGPDPNYAIQPSTLPAQDTMPDSMRNFIRTRTQECKTVFSSCTGAVVLAATGVLDGQNATINHAFVDNVLGLFPQVKWSKDRNWVVSDDGKFWTASGALAGTDMMAAWVRERVADGVFDIMTCTLDYQPRDVYGKPVAYVNGLGKKVDA